MRSLRAVPLGAASAVLAPFFAAPSAVAREAPVAWSAWSASPVAMDGTALSAMEQEALARCGAAEGGLRVTALAVLARKLQGLPMPELDDVARMQRAAGEPHPWARAWVASGRTLDGATTLAKLDTWLGPAPAESSRRCGVASGDADGTRALAIVVVDVLADLAPLPTRARPGQWLTVEATLRVRATGGQVIVLGPSGPPRSLPTSFDGRRLRARFAPESQGEFAVQVMADVAGGPRPVLEATVFAGVEPSARAADRAAPGEDMAEGELDDEDRLAHLICSARSAVGLPPLGRDHRLDAVARDHAMRMARQHQLAHDAGDGDPVDRLFAAGLDPRDAGENVARAATVELAHRALWASPSHRSNLLRREFDRVGVGVVRDDHGEAWVVETFAGDR